MKSGTIRNLQPCAYTGKFSDAAIRQRIQSSMLNVKTQLTPPYDNDPIKAQKLLDDIVIRMLEFRNSCNAPIKNSYHTRSILNHFDFFHGNNPDNSQVRGPVSQLTDEIFQEAYYSNIKSFEGLDTVMSAKGLGESQYLQTAYFPQVLLPSSFGKIGPLSFRNGNEYLTTRLVSGKTGSLCVMTGDNHHTDSNISQHFDKNKSVIVNHKQTNGDICIETQSHIIVTDNKIATLAKATSNVGSVSLTESQKASTKIVTQVQMVMKRIPGKIYHSDNKTPQNSGALEQKALTNYAISSDIKDVKDIVGMATFVSTESNKGRFLYKNYNDGYDDE